MLFVASTYSLLCNIPRIIAIFVNPVYYFTSPHLNEVLVFYIFANSVISPWTYCGNFFFYVASGRQFRREMQEVVRELAAKCGIVKGKRLLRLDQLVSLTGNTESN